MTGLVGVGIGAAASLLGSAGVPWIRDSIDRRRRAAEQLQSERRNWLMSALSALLEMSATLEASQISAARAKFGAAVNELTLRLTVQEQVILDVLAAMHTLLGRRGDGWETDHSVVLTDTMTVLTLWARGDIAVGAVTTEVERRAGLEVKPGHIRVRPRPKPQAPSA